MLDKLGPPPADDPAKLALWTARLMAEVTWAEMRGEMPRTLAARLRADVGAIVRATPRPLGGGGRDDYDEENDDEAFDGAELDDADDADDADEGALIRVG